MPLADILDDWSDYDQEKVSRGISPEYFSCENGWEVEYLAKKIKKSFPTGLRYESILNAIILSCKEVPAPRKRKTLVLQVMRRLGWMYDVNMD